MPETIFDLPYHGPTPGGRETWPTPTGMKLVMQHAAPEASLVVGANYLRDGKEDKNRFAFGAAVVETEADHVILERVFDNLRPGLGHRTPGLTVNDHAEVGPGSLGGYMHCGAADYGQGDSIPGLPICAWTNGHVVVVVVFLEQRSESQLISDVTTVIHAILPSSRS